MIDKNDKCLCLYCGKFGIVVNFILGFTKIILGLISNSISIIIEAVNNITDMFSSILLVLGYKKSINEKMINLIICLFMIITSCIFIYESINKIINPYRLNTDKYFYIILIFTFILKIFQYNIYKNIYLKSKIYSIKIILVETRNDIISSFSTALSLILIGIFNLNLDGYIGLFASISILISSISVMKEITL